MDILHYLSLNDFFKSTGSIHKIICNLSFDVFIALWILLTVLFIALYMDSPEMLDDNEQKVWHWQKEVYKHRYKDNPPSRSMNIQCKYIDTILGSYFFFYNANPNWCLDRTIPAIVCHQGRPALDYPYYKHTLEGVTYTGYLAHTSNIPWSHTNDGTRLVHLPVIGEPLFSDQLLPHYDHREGRAIHTGGVTVLVQNEISNRGLFHTIPVNLSGNSNSSINS